jgi:hypothetical protein
MGISNLLDQLAAPEQSQMTGWCTSGVLIAHIVRNRSILRAHCSRIAFSRLLTRQLVRSQQKTNVVPLGMEARLQFEAPTMITSARQLVEKRFVWDQSTHQNFRTSWQTRVTVKSKRRPRLTEAAISSPSLARFSSRDSSVPRTDC